MMKISVLVMIAAFTVGCSSGDHKQMLIKGAETCNTICMNNPEISEYSHKHGGGLPLLFLGGMEEKCSCNKSSK